MRNFLLWITFVLLLVACENKPELEQKPNILWIYIEDINPFLSCYGEIINPTPNIDKLAKDGVLFKQAYTIAPVCSPTRSAMITGCMPTTLGIHNHHSSRTVESAIYLPEGTSTIPELFKAAGYYTFNNGKDDYNFIYDRKRLYSGNVFNHFWYTFMGDGSWTDKERKPGQPFFGQIQLEGGKHVLPSADAQYFKRLPADRRIDRNAVTLPPYYPDLPEMREDWARHYDAVRITDDEVGEIMDRLKKDGELDNTIVFFFSDHGYKGIRHKQFCYDGGLHVPLIVAYYGKNKRFKKGVERNELVSLLDVSTSTLAMAGIPIPKYMEGIDLFAKDYKPRDYVIGVRDRCDFTIDRIRTVRTENFRYIRNFMPERSYTQPSYRDHRVEYLEMEAYFKAGKMTDVQAKYWLPTKPEEELFDVKNDPDEIHNLANDPKYNDELEKMRKILTDWIAKTDDKGQYPESVHQLTFMLDRWGGRCVNPEYDAARKYVMRGSPRVKIRFEDKP